MRRPVTIVGAPSSIGIRPYDQSAEARHLDRAPSVFRKLGLVARLDADDLGDVAPLPYRDFTRPPARACNENGVLSYIARSRIESPSASRMAGSCWS